MMSKHVLPEEASKYKPYWPEKAPDAAMAIVFDFNETGIKDLPLIEGSLYLDHKFALIVMVVTELTENSCKAIFDSKTFTFNKADCLCIGEGYKIMLTTIDNGSEIIETSLKDEA